MYLISRLLFYWSSESLNLLWKYLLVKLMFWGLMKVKKLSGSLKWLILELRNNHKCFYFSIAIKCLMFYYYLNIQKCCRGIFKTASLNTFLAPWQPLKITEVVKFMWSKPTTFIFRRLTDTFKTPLLKQIQLFLNHIFKHCLTKTATRYVNKQGFTC